MNTAERMDKMKTLRDFERCAREESMNEYAKIYFSSGACSISTPRYNEESLNKYRIHPRVLRDVSKTTLECKMLNSHVSCPIGISPTALHDLLHSEAEIGTAKGCCKEDCVFILSCCSSRPLQEVAEEVLSIKEIQPMLWMQVYIFSDRQVTLDIIRKAESSGFSAVVLTVDSPNNGLWRKMLPAGFFQVVTQRLPNLPLLPRQLLDASLTFDDLKWVVENSKLPIIVKGVLSGEDAKRIAQCGVSGIIVSNHGSRLLERVVPTIDVLEEVVDAVADTGIEVYLDGGIRSGTDVFVSLALGAKAVFIGRPACWGLSLDPLAVVLFVIQQEEIVQKSFISVCHTGVTRIEDIERSMVMKT